MTETTFQVVDKNTGALYGTHRAKTRLGALRSFCLTIGYSCIQDAADACHMSADDYIADFVIEPFEALSVLRTGYEQ